MQQEPTLFATSIKENILLGRPGATEEEVQDAARKANAHTFITSMPAGYDTQVILVEWCVCTHTTHTHTCVEGGMEYVLCCAVFGR